MKDSGKTKDELILELENLRSILTKVQQKGKRQDKALKALFDIDKRYWLLFHSAPDGISILDPKGIIVECNQKMETLYKYKKEEIIGKKMIDLLMPFSIRSYEENFTQLLQGKSREEEFQAVLSDGSFLEIQRKSFPLIGEDSKVAGVLAYDHDITEQKRTEELLLMQGTALEAAANSIVITNIRGDIVWVNNAFTKLTGYSKDDMIYKNVSILKSGKHEKSFYKNLWDTILKGHDWHGEIINMRKDGSLYFEEQTITPVKNTKNELTHFISIKQDITERKDAEEQMRLQQEQLIQADKMVALGTLVSGVAHEINNPNNFIMLNAPILEKTWMAVQPVLDEYYKKQGDFEVFNRLKYSKIKDSMPEVFKGIKDGSSRIKNIVQELKDFARKEDSGLDQDVDINSAVKAAISLMTNMIKKSTNNFNVEYEKDLAKVRGNFQRLEQVVINLLENSCQSLEEKNKSVTIKTCSDTNKNMVTIIVQDEGTGMDEDTIKKITDPFFTTKRHTGGTGLGLSVSSKIILSHGGNLHFESTPGKGTTAIIYLPVN